MDVTDFTWPVAVGGYRLEEFIDSGVFSFQALVSAQPWPVRQYRPLEDFPGLFLTLAQTEPTPEGVLQFANNYGFLGVEVPGLDLLSGTDGGPREERLEDWVTEIGRLREAVTIWTQVLAGQATRDQVEALRAALNRELAYGVAVVVTEDTQSGGLVLGPRPKTLRAAAWFQLARAVTEKLHYRPCRSCGKWLELSPGAGRSDRQFCSDACRFRAYRERQEEARRLVTEGKTVQEVARELETDVKTVRGWIKKGR